MKSLVDRALSGERRALSRILSLCESRVPDHRSQGESAALELSRLNKHKGWRIGFTGPPGAGKSTLIEALGIRLLHQGHRIGVVCVDPSSSLTGGSVLGDRTRMTTLAMHPRCFIRPSAAGSDEGGLTTATRMQLMAIESLHDITFVETVGVGQNEHEVEALVDTMLLVLPPASGDSLQAMKRGIVELADLVVINKADGALAPAAARAASDYRMSLKLLGVRKDGWLPPVLRVSSLDGSGLDNLLESMRKHLEACGDIEARRHKKQWDLLWTLVQRKLVREMKVMPQVKQSIPHLKESVSSGEMSLDMACDELIRLANSKQ